MGDSPPSFSDKFKAVCIALFIGAIALNWAARLITEVWPTLVICGLIGLCIFVAVIVIRWRRDRW